MAAFIRCRLDGADRLPRGVVAGDLLGKGRLPYLFRRRSPVVDPVSGNPDNDGLAPSGADAEQAFARLEAFELLRIGSGLLGELVEVFLGISPGDLHGGIGENRFRELPPHLLADPLLYDGEVDSELPELLQDYPQARRDECLAFVDEDMHGDDGMPRRVVTSLLEAEGFEVAQDELAEYAAFGLTDVRGGEIEDDECPPLYELLEIDGAFPDQE